MAKNIKNIIKETVRQVINEGYYNTMTICVDFDGTVVTHSYPDIGEDIGAVPVLKKLTDAGNRIILYTMRSHRPYLDPRTNKQRDLLQEAIDWYKQNGIPLYGVNSHPTQSSWTDSPKAHGSLTIDDRNLGCPTKTDYNLSDREFADWKAIEKKLYNMGLFDECDENDDFMELDYEFDKSMIPFLSDEEIGYLIDFYNNHKNA